MLNLRWSWPRPAAGLFASIDPAAGAASGGAPVAMLSALPSARIAALAADGDFLRRLGEAAHDLQRYMSEPRWYAGQDGAPAAIAYFSPEYGITAALPQYSGGLGILAGDHLKTASDLGVPLIGVGLLYRHGYFTQSLSADGWQAERSPSDDPNGLPLELFRDASGAPVHVRVGLTAGRELAAQIWVAQVGRVPLLLLDSYVEENEADLHEVTDRLYGGGSDHRLRQELLRGVGGVRAVRAFCALAGYPSPEVFHTNEGHAGFLGLERIREYTQQGLSFDEALEVGRAGRVFTTHPPVPAGIDRFERSLVQEVFADDPLLPIDRVLALGAETYPGGDPEMFNMAVMGMRLAQRVNGVSLLHGQVSREMFTGLWPGFDSAEVPIGSVTNGVHAPSWVAPEILSLAQGGPAEGADPADEGGKLLIQQMVKFADDPRVRHRIVFLPDYDMAMATSLVQGCDIWLNNPLRPLEACGTSGMKAALNGGLNLSVLDGWWDEWFDGGNGWGIPSADGVADATRPDALEATPPYELPSKSGAPLFYDRDADGGPQ